MGSRGVAVHCLALSCHADSSLYQGKWGPFRWICFLKFRGEPWSDPWPACFLLTLLSYHLKATFVNESSIQTSCKKTCGILPSCRRRKKKTRDKLVLCANEPHAICQPFLEFCQPEIFSRRTMHAWQTLFFRKIAPAFPTVLFHIFSA